VHAHIEYSDRHVSHGGHLEEGTEVLTFAFVTVAELDGIDLTDADRYVV
jgi:predicted DNA-binding protein with PD1-like motif